MKDTTEAAEKASSNPEGTKEELRLYLLLRTDLNMSLGKCIAQGGHGFVGAYDSASEDVKLAYKNHTSLGKIVLEAKNLHALERARKECEELGLNVSWVVDAGLTELKGPTPTCMGIGPCLKTQLPKWVSKQRLLDILLPKSEKPLTIP